MKSHEYADLFPMMAEAEIARLSQDIKENGLSDFIITLDDKILDGRNRFKACHMAGIEPRFKEYDGSDPLAFVISHNLHRRHLSESQRAMIASSVAKMRNGGDRRSKNISSSIDELKLTNKDRSQAAKELNVSTASVDRARRIQRDGISELQDMVNSGEVTVYAAQTVAKLPEQDQRKAVSGGVTGVKEAAKKASAKEPTQEPIIQQNTDSPTNRKSKMIIIESNGMAIYASAKSVMDRLSDKDTEFDQSIQAMIDYCEKRKNRK